MDFPPLESIFNILSKKVTQHDFKYCFKYFLVIVEIWYTYQFSACPIPYSMVVEIIFCDYHEQRDNLSTGIPPYFKSCKNGLLKNDHLHLTNIF